MSDYHNGLIFDLETMMARRRLLGAGALVGSGLILGGCRGGPPGDSEPNLIAEGPNGLKCVKTPQETNGPFPADGTNSRAGSTVNALTQSGVVREDIRGSFGGMTGTATGVDVMMSIHLFDVGNKCAPLSGHAIYIWHCDAAGKYSMYDLPDQNYLRGVGVTDANGIVTFHTIFPGCYQGRWPHIHFEIFRSLAEASSGDKSLLISQFALPERDCLLVYGNKPGYEASVSPFEGTSLSSDGIFADNTAEQVKAQTLVMGGGGNPGFKAEVSVGIVST